jgi:hypothetical protein
MPSAGILRESIQVDGSGRISIPMADHQATGAPDALAQLHSRKSIAVRPVSAECATGLAHMRGRALAVSLEKIP